MQSINISGQAEEKAVSNSNSNSVSGVASPMDEEEERKKKYIRRRQKGRMSEEKGRKTRLLFSNVTEKTFITCPVERIYVAVYC